MDRETFTLLRGKFGTERTQNNKYQPARAKLRLVSHTTYGMSTKIVPQYLYFYQSAITSRGAQLFPGGYPLSSSSVDDR